jgi:hypothetical protein
VALRISSDAAAIKRSANVPTQTSFTLAGWFNFASLRSGAFFGPLGIYNGTDGAPGGTGPYYQISSDVSTGNGVLNLWWQDGANASQKASFFTAAANTWYFIAMTSSGTSSGNLVAYVRRMEAKALTSVASTTATNVWTSQRMEWGRDSFSGDFMDGSAMHCVAFDRALDPRELMLLSTALLKEQIPNRQNLNVYYRLRGNTDINDLSGNARDPTLTVGANAAGLRIWPRRRGAAGSSGSTYNDTISEAGSASDSVIAALVAAGGLSESGSAADSVSASGTLAASITEAGSATDGVSSLLVAIGALSESGSAADSVSTGGATYTPTLAEAGSASDAIGSALVGVGALAESGSATDSLTNGSLYSSSITESGSASDQVTSTLLAVGIVTEAASGADVVSAIAVSVAALSESGSAADAVSSLAIRPAALSEAGSAADQVDGSVGAATYNVSVIEAGSATDQVSSALVAARALLENGSATDAVSSVLAALAQLSEAGAAGDVLANVWTGLSSLAEVAAAFDSLSTDGQLFPGKRIVVVRAQVAVKARAQSTVTGPSARSVKFH